ncbi:purine phosphorylase [Pilimelia anulata]|uniref:Purine phosphorylase n=1 Tax=Pilimelia anulata TaxID=53371 RepID=A0A8J3B632_9ACTN|nr:5'-methylthioadenosine/S-adenosylhomocysteine nucleosidase [Pilimelia anulata]GGJ75059.1 purine phosphorylase [Pilimelia anulata]
MTGEQIVVLTALDVEYLAMRRLLRDVRADWHPAGTRFEVGRTAGGAPIAIGLVGKGNHPAAVLAERAIAHYRPPMIMFVGVAGALWPDIRLGDVIVATHVYAYHGGTSEDDGLKARPRVWQAPHAPEQVARHVARMGRWRPDGTDGHPQVRFGPIAAGEVVQDSAVSAHARWVRQTYHDALAIEMEAAGVAQAAHLNRALSALIIRGVSDRADGSKSTSDTAGWQPRAAANAAEFAVGVIGEYRIDGPARPAINGQGDVMGDVRNIATGGAHVGFQAGHITGPVHVAMAAPVPRHRTGVPQKLDDLDRALKQAHTDGRLDADSFRAARDELQAIRREWREDDPASARRVAVPIKRLRGLTLEVVDLAAKIAAIAAAIQAFS